MRNSTRKYKTDEILKIFKEQHRLCSEIDPEADPWAEITGDMTVREWRNANDLLPWRKLGEFLNQEFKINVSENEWYELLGPDRKRKLIDVCEFIAKNADKEIIKPINIFGQECLSAAIFVTLKKNLKNKGVDVSELKPSSKLTKYLNKDFSPLIEEITLTGTRTIEKLELKRKKKGLWNTLNIFDPDRYNILTGKVITFRDLIEKIIEEKNKNGVQQKI